jgi:integrase
MTPEIRKRLEAYKPEIDSEVWERLRPLVISLVGRAKPQSADRALAIAAAVTRYAAWADKRGVAAEANLLDESVLEWFLADYEFASGATEDTYASALRRVLANGSTRKPPRSQRHPLAPPYTAEQQAALLGLADCQPTEAFGVKVESLLRLGLGAGARAAELRYVRPGDVFERYGEVFVRLGVTGDEIREVPLLRAHGQRVAELAKRAKALDLPYLVIGEGVPTSRNGLSHLIKKLNGSADVPRLMASRLRTTWLVHHLRARTPLDVLKAVAGEGTVARLAELLVFVEPLEPETAAKMLAGAGEGPDLPGLRR